MVIPWNTGVSSGAVVVNSTLYCKKRELPPIEGPELATGVKGVHVPSGVGVLPLRALTVMPVPSGITLAQVAVPQLTTWPASITREVKVPAET